MIRKRRGDHRIGGTRVTAAPSTPALAKPPSRDGFLSQIHGAPWLTPDYVFVSADGVMLDHGESRQPLLAPTPSTR
jgi:hypothetical protein